MRKVKEIVLVVLMIFSLTACQSNKQSELTALKHELAAVKEELAYTKNALRIAEDQLRDIERDYDVLESEYIFNKEKKTEAIQDAVEALALSIQEAGDDTDLEKLVEEFANDLTIEVSYVYFGTVDDKFIIKPYVDLPEGYRITKRPVYQQAVAEDLYMAELYMDTATERMVQTVSKAVYVGDELIGVVGIDGFVN